LFQAAKTLQESGELSTGDWKRLEEILDWFNEHLERPERMSISRRPRSKLQAISWFKSTAKQHIQRMREFQRMLEEHGIVVEMIRARRLGYVLYEDDYQVTAYPFNDTPS
jgi:Na+/phosphate symporter